MSIDLGLLRPISPYNFGLTAGATRYSSVLGIMRDGRFRRALRVGGQIALIEAEGQGSADVPLIGVRLLASDGPVEPSAALAQTARVLNTRGDLRAFYDYARSDSVLWPVVEPLYGLHGLQTETVFEALMLTIIEQQISLAGAHRAQRWLLGWGDEGITYEGERYSVFPSAERLAQATIDDLTPTKITFRRMQLMIDLARRELDDSLERLRGLPADDAYQHLLDLKGIGRWTAAWTMTRGLDCYRYFGSADVALRAAVNHYYFGAVGRSDADVTDALFARHGQFDALAAWYTLTRWAFERY
jgi:DNA-3-methyladenine glycosylase II